MALPGILRPRSRIDPESTGSEHVLVPLRLRALHWQQVQLLAFQHEPDGNGDRLPGLPADDADLDLAVAGEAFFEAVFWVGMCTYVGASFT